MKFFLVVVFGISLLFGAKAVEVGERFSKSKNCKSCHIQIVKDWENSWHAKSHYKSDEYFRATIDYVKRKTRKSLNSVKIECATCHNPRISVTSTDMDYEIIAAMKLDKNSAVNKALKSDSINEGINCVVCHNIDKIYTDMDDTKRGINRVKWTKSGIMSGPYHKSISPYHKVEYRDFMDKKSDNLCLVCHANDRSVSGLVFTNMQHEYQENKKACVDCHMGVKKMGVASTYLSVTGEDKKKKPKKREIREHKFSGAHTSNMWKGALKLRAKKQGANLFVTILNPQPHNIPSGFGSRELIVELTFKNGSGKLNTKTISLTRHYTSKRKKPTIPHLAVSMTKDNSIPANGKRVLKVAIEDDTSSVDIRLYYRLVNDEVRSILKLKDSIWSQKMLIESKSLYLK
ncbi:MAG: multiheme c-type cytochrome [Campylobacterota bacterium]|nr:multiheme c-type cytochrome [Campylobacterota bacterium]